MHGIRLWKTIWCWAREKTADWLSISFCVDVESSISTRELYSNGTGLVDCAVTRAVPVLNVHVISAQWQPHIWCSRSKSSIFSFCLAVVCVLRRSLRALTDDARRDDIEGATNDKIESNGYWENVLEMSLKVVSTLALKTAFYFLKLSRDISACAKSFRWCNNNFCNN